GLGGPIGSGRQPVPWIHQDDAARALVHLLEGPLEGPFNVTAPAHDDMRALARALGSVLHRPARVPVPAWALKLRFGIRAPVVLGGQDARPDRLTASGFTFLHPELRPALASLFPRG
ncbi:MAG: DUF1731 domain-containing protein, partial [Thermoplasmatota archaeon]